MALDHCRSCGAPVVWLRHERTGKAAPIDAIAVREGGNILLDRAAGTYRLVPQGEPARHPMLYINHFAVYPHAAQHKRKA